MVYESLWDFRAAGLKTADDSTLLRDPALNIGVLSGPLLKCLTLGGSEPAVGQASDRAFLVLV
jgi:hypothetical protein